MKAVPLDDYAHYYYSMRRMQALQHSSQDQPDASVVDQDMMQAEMKEHHEVGNSNKEFISFLEDSSTTVDRPFVRRRVFVAFSASRSEAPAALSNMGLVLISSFIVVLAQI